MVTDDGSGTVGLSFGTANNGAYGLIIPMSTVLNELGLTLVGGAWNMNAELHNAAVSLEIDLAGYAWFCMIGIGTVNSVEGIIVYVRDSSKSVACNIPAYWSGFPVVYRKMSQPVPLGSTVG